MSDPNIPPRPVTPGTVGTTAGVAPGAARDEYTRTNIHVQAPAGRAVDSGGGLGTGMLVAGVFVVIAILAYVVFGDRIGSNTTGDTAPSVSIENNNTPAADPAPAPAPVPDAAPADPAPAPDTGAADPVAPTPDPAPLAPANP
ncbi:hypothetical protein [Tabrizicola sp.]|uniref:hypothetical protein n=1 Tax=Tabrizicola sp. TaxID=2005166 RepID=UPI00286B7F4C|nr:hypothetical protein [Tabrizicola sp.]